MSVVKDLTQLLKRPGHAVAVADTADGAEVETENLLATENGTHRQHLSLTEDDSNEEEEEDQGYTSLMPTSSSASAASSSPETEVPPPRRRICCTTSCCSIRLLFVAMACFTTHGVFYYGQSRPMWRLLLQDEVNVTAVAVGRQASWACRVVQGKSVVEDAHDELELGGGEDSYLSLSGEPCTIRYERTESEKVLRTFSYTSAIHDLWKAVKIKSKFLARLAAVLLLLFSGVWPHLKLVLLLITTLSMAWYYSSDAFLHEDAARHERRFHRYRRILSTLSTLGKWSLVDVFVVSLLVAVLNLQVNESGPALQQNCFDHIKELVHLAASLFSPEEVCTALMPFDSCHKPHKLIHKIKCQACKDAVSTIYYDPAVTKSVISGFDLDYYGDHAPALAGNLSVQGRKGMYAFCSAVILSIALSLYVDVLLWQWHKESMSHDRAAAVEDAAEGDDRNDATTPLLEAAASDDDDVERARSFSEGNASPTRNGEPVVATDPCRLTDSLMNGTGATHDAQPSEPTTYNSLRLSSWVVSCGSLVLTTATLVVVLCALWIPTMERRVQGAIPVFLRDILDVEWTTSYSLSRLTETVRTHGGWDWLLAGTVGLFLMIGPALRAVLCVLMSLAGLSPRRVGGPSFLTRGLSSLMDGLGAFCAWEVFFASLFMVDLLMPSITSTIFMDDRCAEITSLVDSDGEADDSQCLLVEFKMLRTFGLILGGGAALLLFSNCLSIWQAPK